MEKGMEQVKKKTETFIEGLYRDLIVVNEKTMKVNME